MKNVLFGLLVMAMVSVPSLGEKPPAEVEEHAELTEVANPSVEAKRETEPVPEISDMDLEGEYNLSWKDKGADLPTSLNIKLKKSPLSYKVGNLLAQLYTFDKKIPGLKTRVLGVYMIKDEKSPGKNRLIWVQIEKDGSIEIESSMLLKKEGNALIFGGDSQKEKSEVFRLTKLDKTVKGFGK